MADLSPESRFNEAMHNHGRIVRESGYTPTVFP